MTPCIVRFFILQARKVYDAWNESKTEKILSEKEMKQKAKKAEKEKIEETLQRKKDAEKYFEAWKREKDEHIKVWFIKVSLSHTSHITPYFLVRYL